jgi:antibiotic biosynthesis monooxygenase (ABM) superfamily enzyme
VFRGWSTVAIRRLRSLTLVGALDESQVFFVQEVLKSWFSAVKKTHTPAMWRLFLTIGNVLIYCVNLAVSLGCDLLDNVTMVKHSLVF